MKFNEQHIRKIIQSDQEKLWNDSDLSWFDHEFLRRLETQQLEPELRQDVLTMIAHDPHVFQHYKTLKESAQAHQEPQHKQPFWLRLSFVPLSVLLLVGVSVVFVGYQQSNIGAESAVRSAGQQVASPQDGARLKTVPKTFITQTSAVPIRVEVSRASGDIIWSSQLQKSPQFVLPTRLQSQFVPGSYQWAIYDQNNQLLHTYVFRIAGD